MTYEEAMAEPEEDPFAEIFAWLHIEQMDNEERRVALVVRPQQMSATVFSFNADNYEAETQRVSIPDDLAWDDGCILISASDKRRHDWHKGTQMQLTEWAEGLFK